MLWGIMLWKDHVRQGLAVPMYVETIPDLIALIKFQSKLVYEGHIYTTRIYNIHTHVFLCFSGTNGSSTFKPKLSRRWSLDNLAPNSSREGYVKDLRRQHKAAQQSKASMDEGFPFMLTEARRVNNIYHFANIPKIICNITYLRNVAFYHQSYLFK